MDYLTSYKEMISLRNLSDHTMISYCTYISAYLDFIQNTLHKCPSDVTDKDILRFLKKLQDERGLSDRTINAVIAQIRFFTIYVLHKPWDRTKVPNRKFDIYMPYVPSQEETKEFISTISDLKVKTMVALMYSSGLRQSEVRMLRYEDIHRKKMRVHIAKGKNRSDRYAILSSSALDLLTKYWFEYDRPTGWLFPKQRDKSRPIDGYYLLRHIHEHERELGWPERITCHSFRHAFGTHLYENGADLLTIKALLGHRSLSSTEIYVHLSVGKSLSTVNPFDLMTRGDGNV